MLRGMPTGATASCSQAALSPSLDRPMTPAASNLLHICMYGKQTMSRGCVWGTSGGPSHEPSLVVSARSPIPKFNVMGRRVWTLIIMGKAKERKHFVGTSRLDH